MEAVPRALVVCAALGALLLSLAAPGPARALVICAGSCPPVLPPGPEPTPIPLPEFPGPPALDITGVILPPDAPGLSLQVEGDLVIQVPSGLFTAPAIDLRAGGSELELESDLTWVAPDGLSLCAAPTPCDPLDGELPVFGGDPFRLTLSGPLSGPLLVYASGNILVTTTVVPEPGASLLLAPALGLWSGRRAFRGRSRRRSTRR